MLILRGGEGNAAAYPVPFTVQGTNSEGGVIYKAGEVRGRTTIIDLFTWLYRFPIMLQL